MTRSRKGSEMVEFTLVGIPFIFILISIFEISRGMWTYQTLAYAVKEGTRFAIVKGVDYKNLTKSCTTCAATVGSVVNVVLQAGVGLSAGDLSLTLTSNEGTISCSPASSCIADTRPFPPSGVGDTKGNSVGITGVLPFDSALSMFWPGVSATGQIFGRKWFRAASQDQVQF